MTDASLVLGYLNPDTFAAGSVKLDRRKAATAIRENVALPLGLSVEQAAVGIHRVINAQMAEGIRLVSIRQGLDPRDFTLIPLGGAGPLHGTALARELGMTRVAIPQYPGVLSAIGLLAACTEHDASVAFPRPLARVTLEEVRNAIEELDVRCASRMAGENVSAERVMIRHYADTCYIGQAHHLEIPLYMDAPEPLAKLYQDFLEAHDRIYGHSTNAPASIVNLRTVHSSGGQQTLDHLDGRERLSHLGIGERPVFFPGLDKPIATAIYDREALDPHSIIKGPAIVEQSDTTVLVEPGWQARCVASGILLLSPADS